MADLRQFTKEGRQLSDIAAPVAPIEDKSDAMALGAVASGLSQAAGIASTAFQQIEAGNQLEAEQTYAEELNRVSQARIQHRGNRAALNQVDTAFSDFKRGFLRDNPTMSAGDLATLENKIKGTVLGRGLGVKSIEEEIQDQLIEDATTSGFITPGMDDAQRTEAVAQYQQTVTSDAANKRARDSISLRLAQQNLASNERKMLEDKLKRSQVKGAQEYTKNNMPRVKNTLSAIITEFQATGDRSAAQAMANQLLINIDFQASQQFVDVPKDQRDLILTPLKGMVQNTLNNLDSKTALEQLNNENAIIDASYELQLKVDNPELAKVAAQSTMVNHQSPLLITQLEAMTLDIVKKNSSNTESPAYLAGSGNTSIKPYKQILVESINKRNQSTPTGAPVVDPVELNNNVNQTVKGAARDISPRTTLADSVETYKLLQEEAVAEYIRENKSTLDNEALGQISDTLRLQFQQKVLPPIRTAIEDLFTPSTASSLSDIEIAAGSGAGVQVQGPTTGVSKPGVDALELRYNGSNVVFVGLHGQAQRAAEELNRKVSGALTTYIKTAASVSGQSAESVLNDFKDIVIPKQEAPSIQTETIAVGTKVPESTGDGVFKDGQGNIITVRDGVVTEVRTDGN